MAKRRKLNADDEYKALTHIHSKYAGKGIIRIPEKIQEILETSKGELVTIKPVIK